MSSSDFHSLWPTQLLKRVLPAAEHANTALSHYIIELEKSHSDLTTNYQDQNLFESDHPAVSWLQQSAAVTIKDYLAQAGVNYTVDWSLQGWANINRRGDYHNLHNHPHSYLSGTYYIAIPEQNVRSDQRTDLNPGAISFFDPRAQANMNAIAKDGQVDPEFRVQPEPGLMLLWPSFLHHFVHPNLSNEPRISVSFNVILRWRDDYVPSH